MQKVDPKKKFQGFPPQVGGFSFPSNPHNDLIAQVDPQITLRWSQS